MTDIQLTPIETKMLRILSDGEPHTRAELLECCKPSGDGMVRWHISRIRKKLRSDLRIINTRLNRKLYYQLVCAFVPTI